MERDRKGLMAPDMIVFFSSALFFMVMWFLPLLFVDIGLSGVQIGILLSVYMFVSLFSSFPIGVINDRFSIREVIFAGLILSSLFMFGFSVLKGFWFFMLYYAMGGLGHNMVNTSLRSLIYKLSRRRSEDMNLGVFQFFMSFGASIGYIVGGFLIFILDFDLTLIIGSLLIFILSFLSFLVPKVDIRKFSFWEYKHSLLKKSVFLLLFPVFLFGTHWGAEQTSYSLFLRNFLGLDIFYSGLYMGFSLMAMAIGGIYAGKHINKTRYPKKLFLLGILMSGVFSILMANPNLYLSFLSRFLHEIGDGLMMVSYYIILADIFDKKIIAGESSIAYMALVLGAIVGAPIYGHIGFVYGYHFPFIISGFVSLFSLMIIMARQKLIKF
ncbi:MAG: MFS transporter [Candidatus Aenigmarchaeota archaeon]|nr:MFS transporter [Candidatus Aenigmarchaeota archaeon]